MPNGRVLDFCHLSEVTVDSGAKVKRGYVVGYSGESGIPGVTVQGPHLHEQGWESIQDVRDGQKRVNTFGWHKPR